MSEDEINQMQLQSEIVWCLKQLELSLESGKLNDKRRSDVRKSIKILKNPQSPLIKIRQVMRTSFGDYRAKMEAEAKASGGGLDMTKTRLEEGSSAIAKADKKQPGESVTFIKKSAKLVGSGSAQSSDKVGFRFNFNVPVGDQSSREETVPS